MKKTAAVILLVIVILLIISGVFFLRLLKSEKYRNTDTALNRLGLHLFDYNNIFVNIKGMNKNDIKIYWKLDSDSALVYSNGKYTHGIENQKGVNNFKIDFRNNEIAHAYHFNKQWWYSNKYVFNICILNGDTIVEAKVDGPNQEIHVVQHILRCSFHQTLFFMRQIDVVL